MGFFGFFPDFFDRTHVVESIRVLVKKREGYGRVFLFIFLGMMTLYTFQRDEKPFLYLYTQLKFHWGVTDYSYFKTFQSSAYCIVTLIGIPLMNRVLKWKDTVNSWKIIIGIRFKMELVTGYNIHRLHGTWTCPYCVFVSGGSSAVLFW